MARFETGAARLTELPLWEMKHDWGVAGTRALERLAERAATPGQEALAERLALLERSDARYALRRDAEGERAAELQLAAALRVLPEGAEAPANLIEVMLRFGPQDLNELCAAPRSDDLPACLLYLTDFIPAEPGGDAVLMRAGAGLEAILLYSERGGDWSTTARYAPGLAPGDDMDAAMRALIAGQGTMVPAGLLALEVDGKVIGIRP